VIEFLGGTGAGFPGMGTAVRLRTNARRAGIPGLAAHGWCYLVAPFLAAAPFLAPSSGLIASYRLSANFRWELSSSSAKS